MSAMSHRTQLQASTSGHSRLTCPSAATALQRKRSAGFCGRGGARVATASLAPETQQRAVRSPARESHTHLRGVPMLSCRACAGIETHAAPSCSPSVPLPCCPHRRQLSAPSRHTLSPPQALSPAASAAGVAWPDLVFDVVTVLMVCLYGLLCFAPKARLVRGPNARLQTHASSSPQPALPADRAKLTHPADAASSLHPGVRASNTQ